MPGYEVSRSTTVAAPPERVRALVDDLHAWTRWSPWEGSDPDLQRTYSGPATGVGSRYAWSGNRKAGRGSMEITSSSAGRVDLDVAFEKPFASTSQVSFLLVPVGAGTEVTWRMTGEQHGVMGVLGRVVPMDRIVGKDFERGLAQLKETAEADPG